MALITDGQLFIYLFFFTMFYETATNTMCLMSGNMRNNIVLSLLSL